MDTEIQLVQTMIDDNIENLSLAPINAFVWDAAERNVMIQNGQFCGLVDQDELCMGDKWMAPGLALATLSILEVPWAHKYAMRWVANWHGGTDEISRMILYAILFTFSAAAKTGRILPDGRIAAGIPNGLIKTLCNY